MSASHHPTDIHLRQHRAKKRDKLRARIAATPATGRAALEARVLRTYSLFHSMTREKKLPPTVVQRYGSKPWGSRCLSDGLHLSKIQTTWDEFPARPAGAQGLYGAQPKNHAATT